MRQERNFPKGVGPFGKMGTDMKKKQVKLKGRLRIYMQTSLYLGLLLVLVDLGVYLLDLRAGFLLSCFLILYFAMIFLSDVL